MDLSIVIPSYNTRELLEQALRTVMDAAEGLEVELLVVDNASRDGSAEMVASTFPQIELIRNEENVGFSAANNQALRRVKGRYVLLLNSDTIVRPDTLRCLVEFLDAHPHAGAIGCKILNPDGTLQLSCRRGPPTPMAAFCKMSGLSRLFPNSPRIARYNLTYLDPEKTHEVDALSGSCMMVRKEAIDQVGLLDEAYFFYGEDLDWCFRMRKAGWKIFYVPKTEIIHFKGESSRAEQMRFRYRFYEAMTIFVRKHMQQRYRFFPLWLLHVAIVFYGLLSLGANLARKLSLPITDGALILIGLKFGLILRYHPSLEPLIRRIESLANQIGLDAHPTNWLVPPEYTDLQWFLVYTVSALTWLLALYLVGIYDRHKYSAAWSALGVALGFGGIVTMVFFIKPYNFSRLAAGAAWGFNTILVAGWRLVAPWAFLTYRGYRLGQRRTLVVGTDEAVESLLNYMASAVGLGFEVVGVVGREPEMRGRMLADSQVIGLVDELQQLVHEYRIDALIFTSGTIVHSLKQMGKGWGTKKLQVYMLAGNGADLQNGQVPRDSTKLPLIEVLPRR